MSRSKSSSTSSSHSKKEKSISRSPSSKREKKGRSESADDVVRRKRRRDFSKSVSRSRSRSRNRSRSRERPREEGHRVFVADLDYKINSGDLVKNFQKFGPILEVWCANTTPRFGFVVFQHKDDAQEAVQEMDGEKLGSRNLKVSMAFPRGMKGKGSRGGRDNRCYNCGIPGHFSRECRGSRKSYPFNRDRFSKRPLLRRPPRSWERDRDSDRNKDRDRERDRDIDRDIDKEREKRGREGGRDRERRFSEINEKGKVQRNMLDEIDNIFNDNNQNRKRRSFVRSYVARRPSVEEEKEERNGSRSRSSYHRNQETTRDNENFNNDV